MEKTTAKRGKKFDTACRKVVLTRMFDKNLRRCDIMRELDVDASLFTKVLDGTRFTGIVQDKFASMLDLDRDILFSNRRCSRRTEGLR